MSIALSVVVKPSRRLRALRWGYALGLAAAGAGVAGGLLGHYAWPGAVACAPLCASVLAAGAGRGAKMRRLDISGLGELRVTVQQTQGSAARVGVPVRLMAGSTLWPEALLLRFGTDGEPGAAVLHVVLLPDSVEGGGFRALAAAFAAIAQLKNV